MNRSLLSGKVAIITGAGNGLGLAYAHALASHGCQLVINDIGAVTAHGDQQSPHSSNMGQHHAATGAKEHAADQVVQELRSKYNRNNIAAANYSPVSYENAKDILNTALQAFGRVDILINNAGIVRDKVFEKTSEKDWSMLTEVHLNGVYRLSQLVYSQFLKQMEQDRKTTVAHTNIHGNNNTYKILFVSSIAVYGSFGQTAYSALKSAMIGLCHSLAKETETRHLPIHVNTIMPLADSRILRTSHLPDHVYDMLHVNSISPAIVYLVSPLCQENGGIFELAGGVMHRHYIQRSSAAVPIVKDVYELHELWSSNASPSAHAYKSSDEAIMHLLETIANPPTPATSVVDKYGTIGTRTSENNKATTTTTRRMEQDLKELFETIKNNLAAMPKDEKLPPNKFVYVLSNDKRYLLDLKERTLRQLSSEGEDANVKGDVTITMSDEDFIKLMNGQAQPQQLFFAKKLKIGGNMGLAMKMISIREKLVRNASEGQQQPLKSKL